MEQCSHKYFHDIPAKIFSSSWNGDVGTFRQRRKIPNGSLHHRSLSILTFSQRNCDVCYRYYCLKYQILVLNITICQVKLISLFKTYSKSKVLYFLANQQTHLMDKNSIRNCTMESGEAKLLGA